MRRRYVTIDVFTEQPFGGNPLAVVLDAEGLSGSQMRSLAREFNYFETTFVLPPADPAHHACVRIFTPLEEIPFAGHPNVGTAVVLARRAAGAAPERLVFEEAAGLVAIDLIRVAGEVVGAEVTAPSPFNRGTEVAAAPLAAALGLTTDDLTAAAHPPTMASVGLPFLFAELVSRAGLARVSPDMARLADLLRPAGAVGAFVYTRDNGGADGDLQARMFSPGIGEDPATGSATAALGALLASLAAAPDLDLVARVAQGVDLGRPSLLRAHAIKRGGQVTAARVGGRAVEMMEGSFYLASL